MNSTNDEDNDLQHLLVVGLASDPTIHPGYRASAPGIPSILNQKTYNVNGTNSICCHNSRVE